MSRACSPKDWRELREQLHALGAEPIRAKGSHETWRFGDGEIFIVVINHLADAVPLGIRVKFQRLRQRRHASTGEEPLLLGLAGSW